MFALSLEEGTNRPYLLHLLFYIYKFFSLRQKMAFFSQDFNEDIKCKGTVCINRLDLAFSLVNPNPD
jgi:hypothetical protein